MNYYLSLGYLSNEGVARGNEYSAIRSNMKLNAQITSWLNVGQTLIFRIVQMGILQLIGKAKYWIIVHLLLPYNENGELVPHPMGENAY